MVVPRKFVVAYELLAPFSYRKFQHMGDNCAYFWLISACGRRMTFFVQRSVSVLSQDMLLHDVCTGRADGGRTETFFVEHIQKAPRPSQETGFNMGLRMYCRKSSWDMT